jgi:hypothetical protein
VAQIAVPTQLFSKSHCRRWVKAESLIRNGIGNLKYHVDHLKDFEGQDSLIEAE